MRNLLIMGFGRSGTSATAGLFAECGYFHGEWLWSASDSNPRGFFEDREVNAINESLLMRAFPLPGWKCRLLWWRKSYVWGARWLAPFPLHGKLAFGSELRERIQKVVSRTPFCLKDPRFSATFPAWRPHLPADTRIVVCFRDPHSVIASVEKELKSAPYLDSFKFASEQIRHSWLLTYERIFEFERLGMKAAFIDFDDLLSGRTFAELESWAEAPVNPDFIEPRLKRTRPLVSSDPVLESTFQTLLERRDAWLREMDLREPRSFK